MSKKTALLDSDLECLVYNLDPTTLAGRRDRALLLVGFTDVLRGSELVIIDVEHLDFRSERPALTIPFSRTDQTGQSVNIVVPVLPLLLPGSHAQGLVGDVRAH